MVGTIPNPDNVLYITSTGRSKIGGPGVQHIHTTNSVVRHSGSMPTTPACIAQIHMDLPKMP